MCHCDGQKRRLKSISQLHDPEEMAMDILKKSAIKKQTVPHAYHFARICCTPAVSKLKREASTATDWQTADPAILQTLRTMADAGNEKFGSGSHWIERRYTAHSSTR